MFIVGIPLTQQPPGQGETSAACGMAQVPVKRRAFGFFSYAGFTGLGFLLLGPCSVPLFDWLSAVGLLLGNLIR